MKNIKRIFAVLGIVLLVGLYLATLIFAVIGSPRAMECLKVSIGFTILIPVLLWIYLIIFRYMKEKKEAHENASDNLTK